MTAVNNVLHATPEVVREIHPDGTQYLRSKISLEDTYPCCVGEWLEHWAKETPEHLFIAERGVGGEWEKLSYRQVREQVMAIATWLLGRNLSPERPVVILSDNSVEHALIMYAAMHIGVPSCAISAGYSLLSKDHERLKTNIQLLNQGVVFVDVAERFVPALNAIRSLHDGVVVAGKRSQTSEGNIPFSELLNHSDETRVLAKLKQITPDTIAKFLFTSGSTGTSGTAKAVINTQRMLCSNQASKKLMWPFLNNTKPVLLDWLPWSHTFGSNHNLNMALYTGGTFYIDEGKPVPHLLDKTISNIKEISPTLYFSVPRAYDMLVPLLREDKELRQAFFKNLKSIFYAGAALPAHLWLALEELATQSGNPEVLIVSAWGSTETAPNAVDCHFRASRPGVIGIPVPGTTLKLIPNAGKLEVRVKGPNVFPGYWKHPELSAKAFDEEGFYKIGDAMKYVDDTKPELGLLFDGRVSEDFKLLSGTWVAVGSVRINAIDALKPVAQDIVVTGHEQDEVGFLIFPNIPECRRLAGLNEDASIAAVLQHPKVREQVQNGLAALKQQGGGTSSYATRAMLLEELPAAEAGEITDKGYINQSMVLKRRADQVTLLYAQTPHAKVIYLP